MYARSCPSRGWTAGPFGTTSSLTDCWTCTMPSKKRCGPLDHFQQDVPVTPEDSRAQWLIRDHDRLTPQQYLEWCSYLTRNTPASHDELAADSHEPFEL